MVEQSERVRRSWFTIGFGLAVGALVAYHLAQSVVRITGILTLVLLALFIAISLEPMVGWLLRGGLRRAWAVLVLALAVLGLAGGFVALVIPPLSGEIDALAKAVPAWLQQLHDHQSVLGRLEDRYHLVDRAKQQLNGGNATTLVNGVLGAGQLLLSTLTDLVIVCTLTLYFLAGLPTIKAFGYRFVPRTRRARVEELVEEILIRTGRFMLANIVTSAIAGLATFLWLEAWGVPYPAVLGLFVALMDLVPVVGSTIGGVVVSLVALVVSFPVALGTAAFYTVFRLAEDYLIMPRAMKYAVEVHPVVTVLAVLIGGALLGIVGALVAVPVAVALGLVLDEVLFPQLERV
ncbi:putative PurR-regulated permease PerM [Kitasatospora sp. MAA4]|uniref:AI-2E family transporter n=1 Tax=Kitasatospora sp. MAA4 TaxID=3035093 RepID=UPI0024739313|nr:AI-2E family transporter [Kitasatospora sp. MAA4]MDH6132047.1 putative PurR-regulated permease PerM [Kitasatospora sp. MAA4]